MRLLRPRTDSRIAGDDHNPHLPHEEPAAWFVSTAVAVIVGIVVIGATFALFG